MLAPVVKPEFLADYGHIWKDIDNNLWRMRGADDDLLHEIDDDGAVGEGSGAAEECSGAAGDAGDGGGAAGDAALNVTAEEGAAEFLSEFVKWANIVDSFTDSQVQAEVKRRFGQNGTNMGKMPKNITKLKNWLKSATKKDWHFGLLEDDEPPPSIEYSNRTAEVVTAELVPEVEIVWKTGEHEREMSRRVETDANNIVIEYFQRNPVEFSYADAMSDDVSSFFQPICKMLRLANLTFKQLTEAHFRTVILERKRFLFRKSEKMTAAECEFQLLTAKERAAVLSWGFTVESWDANNGEVS